MSVQPVKPVKPTDVAGWRAALATVCCANTLLRQFDIPGMLASIERADSVGPILDPTLWRENQEAMNEDRELLEAALPLYRFFEERPPK